MSRVAGPSLWLWPSAEPPWKAALLRRRRAWIPRLGEASSRRRQERLARRLQSPPLPCDSFRNLTLARTRASSSTTTFELEWSQLLGRDQPPEENNAKAV